MKRIDIRKFFNVDHIEIFPYDLFTKGLSSIYDFYICNNYPKNIESSYISYKIVIYLISDLYCSMISSMPI